MVQTELQKNCNSGTTCSCALPCWALFSCCTASCYGHPARLDPGGWGWGWESGQVEKGASMRPAHCILLRILSLTAGPFCVKHRSLKAAFQRKLFTSSTLALICSFF